MLLFMMGFHFPSLLIVTFLVCVLGIVIFRFSKRIWRRALKNASDQKIIVLSRLSAFVLTPMLFIGMFAIVTYVLIGMAEPSEEELVKSNYILMEQGLAGDLKLGMSKADVMQLLGEADSTQSVMVYDLSMPDAQEKYFLELSFEQGLLVKFERKK